MIWSLIRFVVYSNFWIALAAVAITYATNELAGIPHSLNILAFTGGSTLCAYTFLRLTGMDRSSVPSTEMGKWVARYNLWLWFVTIAGGVVAFYFFWTLSIEGMILAGVMAVITALYIVPVWPGEYRPRALRELPYIKLWAIAFVWMASTVWLPLINGGSGWADELLWALSTERFFTIAALCIPFDIRDVRDDLEGQKTLPQSLGIAGSKWFGTIIMILSLFAFYFISKYAAHHGPDLWYASVAYPVFGAVLWASTERRRELYYTGLVDGLIILQALLWILLF